MNTCNHPTACAETIHRPQFRIQESDSGTQVHIALPGVRKEDLKLTLLEASLKIEAKRNQETPPDWKTHRDPGQIQRYGLTLRLSPRLDGTHTTATLEAGVLTLLVALREESKPRQIHVN